jgi:hypothetical protein
VILIVCDALVACLVAYGSWHSPSPWWLVASVFLGLELLDDIAEWRRTRRR